MVSVEEYEFAGTAAAGVLMVVVVAEAAVEDVAVGNADNEAAVVTVVEVADEAVVVVEKDVEGDIVGVDAEDRVASPENLYEEYGVMVYPVASMVWVVMME